jgi:excisionase family DNA binding protein
VDGGALGRGGAGRLARVPTSPRFLQLADVAEVLNISAAQVYALVRSGDLPAIKIGGRGQWRVEVSELEGYIARMYEETRDFVSTHPLGRTDDDDTDDADDDAKVDDQS